MDVNGKGANPLFTFLKNAFGIKVRVIHGYAYNLFYPQKTRRLAQFKVFSCPGRQPLSLRGSQHPFINISRGSNSCPEAGLSQARPTLFAARRGSHTAYGINLAARLYSTRIVWMDRRFPMAVLLLLLLLYCSQFSR